MDRASSNGASGSNAGADASDDSAMNLPPLSELQVTIREDHVLEGALDVRFNFDLTFHRQMMGMLFTYLQSQLRHRIRNSVFVCFLIGFSVLFSIYRVSSCTF